VSLRCVALTLRLLVRMIGHMAKTTTVTVTDDIDGSANAHEIQFSYKGINYSIELGRKNAPAFDKAIKPYVDAATRVPSRGRAAATRGSRASAAVSARGESQAVRQWAAENGIAVNARGRISRAIREQYVATR
jgi:hypothetical protein